MLPEATLANIGGQRVDHGRRGGAGCQHDGLETQAGQVRGEARAAGDRGPGAQRRAAAFVQPTIRGVGTAVASSGGGANVGIYVDGFYSPNPLAADFQLMSLKSVQVLKGPQGTLFGRNTTAGIVKFDTIKPSQDYSGRVQASYGSFGSVAIDGGVGGAINDIASFRVSALYQHRDDYVDNTYRGPSADGTVSPKKNAMGGFDDRNVRAQLLLTPSEAA